MALGTVKIASNTKRAVCILAAATATNSPPASSTAGIPMYPTSPLNETEDGACYQNHPASRTSLIVSAAGTGTMTVTLVLWGYLAAVGVWIPMAVNANVAIAETSADVIRYREVYSDLGHFDRLYLEVSGIAGTTNTVEAWVVNTKEYV